MLHYNHGYGERQAAYELPRNMSREKLGDIGRVDEREERMKRSKSVGRIGAIKLIN